MSSQNLLVFDDLKEPSSGGSERRWQSGSSATDRHRWTQDQMVACPGVGKSLPAVSLSSSLFSPSLPAYRPVPLPRSCPPGQGGTGLDYGAGPRAPPMGAVLTTAGTNAASVSPLSPCESFDPLPATRVAGRSGLACWHCRDPEHLIHRCPMMEAGKMFWVPDALQAALAQAGWYQIPVRFKGSGRFRI